MKVLSGYTLGHPHFLGFEVAVILLVFLVTVFGLRLRTVNKFATTMHAWFSSSGTYHGRYVVIGSALVLTTFVANFMLARAIDHQPRIHDEVAYVFGAQTFLEGRLSNPPHAYAEFFQPIHILSHPRTVSKYPPAQSLFLAAGEYLGIGYGGGVAISSAFAAGALFFLLSALFPLRWSIFGTAIFVGRFILLTYWGVEFWGGAVTAAGGALAMGGLVHWVGNRRLTALLAMSIGLLVLSTTRPYQGLAVALPVLAVLALHLAKNLTSFRANTLRAIGVLLLSAVSIVAFLGYYNYSTTGNALTLPYMLHEQQFKAAPTFLWQEIDSNKFFDNPYINEMWGAHGEEVDLVNRLKPSKHHITNKLEVYWTFYCGVGLSILLLFSLNAAVKWKWFFFGTAAFTFGADFLVWPAIPHYLAPITACFVVLTVAGAQAVAAKKWRDFRIGKAAVIACSFGMLLAISGHYFLQISTFPDREIETPWLPWPNLPLWGQHKNKISQILSETEKGKHLILLPVDDIETDFRLVHQGWVGNHPDIDAADIIWAYDLENLRRESFLAYFSERHIWRLQFRGYDQAPSPIYVSAPQKHH